VLLTFAGEFCASDTSPSVSGPGEDVATGTVAGMSNAKVASSSSSAKDAGRISL